MALLDINEATLTEPDKHAIATSLITGARRVNKHAPNQVDLASAITHTQLNTVRAGAPSVVLTIADPNLHLFDSDFFDPTEDGTLDPLEMNYPDGSEYWWRLSIASFRPASRTFSVTFVPRLVAIMQRTWKRKKANRKSTTRAEFLKSLVVECGGTFYCRQLDEAQPIAGVAAASTSHSRGKTRTTATAHKASGVSSAQKHLTSNGSPLSASQMSVVNIALAACKKHNAPQIVAQAMIYAGMGENGLSTTDTWQNSTSQSTAVEAEAWLMGGDGFQQGGGIACAKANPGYSAWQIANAVEANAVWNATRQDSYAANAFNPAHGGVGQARALAEALAIVQGGGLNGSASGTVETIQPYYFTVGTSSAPNESYWDAAQRLSQEVAWDFIVDGDKVYYDSEMTLITQKVAASFDRDDLEIIDWPFDWDTRNICTNFSLTIMAGMFDFWSGDVLEFHRFGPASRGSTAKLPGRWLVDTIQRDKASLTSTLALVQPTRPKKEPAPQVTRTSTSKTGSGGSVVLKGGATNPAPGATWGRLDMGFDGNYGPAGAVAPFDGTIRGIGIGGWPGQGQYFVVRNNDQSGPDYTRAMYFAEGATPIYPEGTQVKAGQKVGNPVASGGNGSPGNYEIGPANTSNYDTLAKSYGLGSSGARQMVLAFEAWLVSLGASKSPNPSAAGNH